MNQRRRDNGYTRFHSLSLEGGSLWLVYDAHFLGRLPFLIERAVFVHSVGILTWEFTSVQSKNHRGNDDAGFLMTLFSLAFPSHRLKINNVPHAQRYSSTKNQTPVTSTFTAGWPWLINTMFSNRLGSGSIFSGVNNYYLKDRATSSATIIAQFLSIEVDGCHIWKSCSWAKHKHSRLWRALTANLAVWVAVLLEQKIQTVTGLFHFVIIELPMRLSRSRERQSNCRGNRGLRRSETNRNLPRIS